MYTENYLFRSIQHTQKTGYRDKKYKNTYIQVIEIKKSFLKKKCSVIYCVL